MLQSPHAESSAAVVEQGLSAIGTLACNSIVKELETCKGYALFIFAMTDLGCPRFCFASYNLTLFVFVRFEHRLSIKSPEF